MRKRSEAEIELIPTPPPRWFYYTRTTFHAQTNSHLQDELQLFGKSGWELDHLIYGNEGFNHTWGQVGQYVTLIFRRPERDGDYHASPAGDSGSA